MASRRLRLLSVAAAALFSAASPLGALTVGRIGVTPSAAGYEVRVATGGLAVPQLETVPGKIIIVVPDGRRSLKALTLAKGPVRRIRFGLDGSKLHMVMDLRRRVRARIGRVSAMGFVIELSPLPAREPAVASAASTRTAAVRAGLAAAQGPTATASAYLFAQGLGGLDPAKAGYRYRVVDLSLSESGHHGELVVSADGPARYSSSVRQEGRLLRLDFHNSSLAWSGSAKGLRDAAVASVSASQVRLGGQAGVRVDVLMTGAWNYALRRDQNQIVVRIPLPVAPAPAPAKGDMDAPVSLDVQGADLVGVLKTLCEQAGFEYQFTRTLLSLVPPNSLVTMKADNRPFHEVVDTLLAQVQCNEVRLGNTIYMGTAGEIDTRRQQLPVVTRDYSPQNMTPVQAIAYLTARYAFNQPEQTRLKLGVTVDPRDPTSLMLAGAPQEVARWEEILRGADASSGGGGGGGNQQQTQVYHLNYLDATNASLITGAIDQLYPQGAILPTPLIDPATRTLVVTTQPRYLRQITRLLAKIDVRPPQVNIEGKIIEVDQSVASQLGINWTSGPSSGTSNLSGAFNTNFTNPFTSQLTYGTIIDGANISAQIQALVDTLKADIVSAPNITTIDNQPATISTTQVQVYLQTTTTISAGVVTNANTFPTSNVPLTLVVTPKISRVDHRILMNINFQLTTTNGTAPAIGAPLPTNQEEAITNVTVNSGNTFVIGGLVKQNNTEEVRKVPLLGDIPLLGLLFRYNSTNKAKSEIIIFIKPTIVGD